MPTITAKGIAVAAGLLMTSTLTVSANAATAESGPPHLSTATAPLTPAPVQDGDFTFKITKVGERTTPIGSEPFGKKPQGKFVLVYITITNHGDEAGTFHGGSQKLLAGDKEYSADATAAIYLKSANSFLEQINPGNSARSILVFDVPRSIQPTGIEFHDSAFSGGITSPLR
ncbi:hypothetical protein GCM10027589_52180 [Actinocorallia lasiicapitis]